MIFLNYTSVLYIIVDEKIDRNEVEISDLDDVSMIEDIAACANIFVIYIAKDGEIVSKTQEELDDILTKYTKSSTNLCETVKNNDEMDR